MDDDKDYVILEGIARSISMVVGRSPTAEMLIAALIALISGIELFANLSNWILGFVVGGAIVYYALTLLVDRFASLPINIGLVIASPTIVGSVAMAILLSRVSTIKELALSVSYLDSVKSRNFRAKVGLIVCSALLLVTAFALPHLQLLDAAMISSGVLALIFLKEAVLKYRIRNGLFGSNRSEARDLIDFLVKNSEDIDFTDTNGRLRRVLEPEKDGSYAESTRPAEGGAVT